MGRGRSDRYWDPCVWGGAAVVGALPPDHVTKDVCGGWVFGYFHHGGRPADGDLLLCRPCEDTAGQQRRLCVCCRQRAEAADLRYSLCIAGYCPGERTQVATPGGAWCASHLRLDKKDQWTQWCSAEYLPKYPKWAAAAPAPSRPRCTAGLRAIRLDRSSNWARSRQFDLI